MSIAKWDVFAGAEVVGFVIGFNQQEAARKAEMFYGPGQRLRVRRRAEDGVATGEENDEGAVANSMAVMVDAQWCRDALTIIELTQASRMDEALALDEDLRQRIVQSTQSDPRSMLEAVGMIATTLRKGNQKGMALPWYEDTCALSTRLHPRSPDTAWNWYYLGDILAVCADSVDDPESSKEYREKAVKAAERAATFYKTSGATSETLKRNIEGLRHRLNP